MLVHIAGAKNAATPAVSSARCTAYFPARKGHENPMHVQAMDNSGMQEAAQEVNQAQVKTHVYTTKDARDSS